MDDDAFLADVAARLPALLHHDDALTVVDVRSVGGRSWRRAEVGFTLDAGTVDGEPVPATSGSAFAPLDEDWRWLSGYERAEDYAQLLADQVERAAREAVWPSPRPAPPTGPDEVALRWEWLRERLALSGRVLDQPDGSLRVLGEDVHDFTVLVTPQEWARIAEPIDPDSWDPQDFNPMHDQESFLVFHEDALVWSMRAELPPVRFGGEIRRRFREARERGDDLSSSGWFAYDPLDPQDPPGERYEGP